MKFKKRILVFPVVILSLTFDVMQILNINSINANIQISSRDVKLQNNNKLLEKFKSINDGIYNINGEVYKSEIKDVDISKIEKENSEIEYTIDVANSYSLLDNNIDDNNNMLKSGKEKKFLNDGVISHLSLNYSEKNFGNFDGIKLNSVGGYWEIQDHSIHKTKITVFFGSSGFKVDGYNKRGKNEIRTVSKTIQSYKFNYKNGKDYNHPYIVTGYDVNYMGVNTTMSCYRGSSKWNLNNIFNVPDIK